MDQIGCPIFDEQMDLIGLWSPDEAMIDLFVNSSFVLGYDHSSSFGARGLQFGDLNVPIHYALVKNSKQRIPNDLTELESGAQFKAGVFVMIKDQIAPNDDLANPLSIFTYVLVYDLHYDIKFLKRIKRSHQHYETTTAGKPSESKDWTEVGTRVQSLRDPAALELKAWAKGQIAQTPEGRREEKFKAWTKRQFGKNKI